MFKAITTRYQELPFERWGYNAQLFSLTLSFFDAGGQVGTPRRPDGTLDPLQESGGWVGVYAPDEKTAQEWRKIGTGGRFSP